MCRSFVVAAVRRRSGPNRLPAAGRDGDFRELTLDYFEPLYATGPSGNFYNELIRMAGGVNTMEEGSSYVKLSQEGVLESDPEVILDLVGDQSYYHAPDAAAPVALKRRG